MQKRIGKRGVCLLGAFLLVLLFLLPMLPAVSAENTLAVETEGISRIEEGTEMDGRFAFCFKANSSSRIEFWGYKGRTIEMHHDGDGYAIMPEEDSLSGKIGCWIYRVGDYRGDQVDIRCTFFWDPVRLSDGTAVHPVIAPTLDKENGRIHFHFATSAYEVQYEIYIGGKPAAVDMSLNIGDIDYAQYYGFQVPDGTVHAVQCTTDSRIYYRKMDGYDWIYAKYVSSDLELRDSIRYELQNVRKFRLIYGIQWDIFSHQIERFMPETSAGTYTGEKAEKHMKSAMTGARAAFERGDEFLESDVKTGTAYFDATGYGPYPVPDPVKQVKDTDETAEKQEHNTITADETFQYEVISQVPLESDTYRYSGWELQDTLPEEVRYVSGRVLDEVGTDVTDRFTAVQEGQKISLTADEPGSDTFYQQTYRWVIQVRFLTPEKADQDCIFRNQAVLRVTRGGETEERMTNQVETVYPVTSRTVRKIWEDSGSRNRPEELQAELLRNGKSWRKLTLRKADSYSITETGLPLQDAMGKPYEYTVRETVPAGYEASYQEEEGTLLIRNTELRTLTVEKVWEDDGDRDGLRPDQVEVTLLADGKEAAAVTLEEKNSWKGEVRDLPVTKDGKVIDYVWQEAVPGGYSLRTVTKGDHTVLHNRHEPKTADLLIRKIWKDENDLDRMRPEVLEVILYADDEAVRTLTLTENTGWKALIRDLPEYSAGRKIVYRFEGKATDGYEAEQSTEGEETVFTNTHRTVSREISGLPWIDTNGNGIRESGEPVLHGVTVTLLQQTDHETYEVLTGQDGYPVRILTGSGEEKTFTIRQDGTERTVTASAEKDGGYRFTGIPAGVFALRFEGTDHVPLAQYTMSPQHAGRPETDSDAAGIFEQERLSAAVIREISAPSAAQVPEGTWKKEHLDAGFVPLRGSIRLQKTDAGGRPVSGAAFRITHITDSGKEETEEAVTDEKGFAAFTGLEAGSYRIEETGTGREYALLAEPIEVVLPQVTNEEPESYSYRRDGRYYQLDVMYTIRNADRIRIPQTGGSGTGWYLTAGIICVFLAAAGAGFAVLRREQKRRKRVKEDKEK